MENKIDNLKEILLNIDIKNFNLDIIFKNISTLITLKKDLSIIWNESDINSTTIEEINLNSDKNNSLNKNLNNYISNYDSMVESEKLSDFVKSLKKRVCFKYANICFFYVFDNENQLKQDLEKIYSMLKITFVLNKFIYPNDKISRHIVWIPINSNRDFKYENISKDNLEISKQEYKAFTVSGVTYGNNPRVTVVTRYEEVTKLLLHELIHNFNLDGSNFHTELKPVIKKFSLIKKTSGDDLNYNYEYSMYESYTELLGTYLYLIFINIDINDSKLEDVLLGQIGSEIIYSYNIIANLSKLNKYDSYEEFIRSQTFMGSICIYEYYYVKGLLYNNFELVFPSGTKEFIRMYSKINYIIKNSSKDNLLKQIFSLRKSQTNFKYIIN